MKSVVIGSAVLVVGLTLAGCGGSTTVATAPPSSPSPTGSTGSGGEPIPYDQIDLAKWRAAMLAAGASHDIDMQAVYAATVKFCTENGHKLSLDLATKIAKPQSERVAFKYVCPSRLKAFDSGSQVAD